MSTSCKTLNLTAINICGFTVQQSVQSDLAVPDPGRHPPLDHEEAHGARGGEHDHDEELPV